jgi:hypothetical protein
VANLKDILNEEDDLHNDDLLKYVQGDLSKEELLEVEKQMANSDFVSDAVEGLQNIRNKKSIDQYVDELNQHLHNHIEGKKKRKLKRQIKDQQWIYLAVVIILGICLLCYVVVKRYQTQQNDPSAPKQIEQKKN